MAISERRQVGRLLALRAVDDQIAVLDDDASANFVDTSI
jgi:hypothetical protein